MEDMHDQKPPRRLTSEMVRWRVVDAKPADQALLIGFPAFGTGLRVDVHRTLQPRGGTRTWFHCPSCERRCSVLYGEPYLGCTGWKCRICWNLAYPSQRQRQPRRWWEQAERLTLRLSGERDNGTVS